MFATRPGLIRQSVSRILSLLSSPLVLRRVTFITRRNGLSRSRSPSGARHSYLLVKGDIAVDTGSPATLGDAPVKRSNIKMGTALKDIPEVPPAIVEMLNAASLTTVRELVSHYYFDRKTLGSYIQISDEDLDSLVTPLLRYLGTGEIDRIRSSRPKPRPLGGKSPYSPAYEEFMRGRRRDDDARSSDA